MVDNVNYVDKESHFKFRKGVRLGAKEAIDSVSNRAT